MNIELSIKPKSPIIIEGFPGVGFVGTIAAEFLVDHLKTKSIGKIWSDKVIPMAIIHKGQLRKPIEIFYNKDYNLIILHAISDIKKVEWDLADSLVSLAKQLKAKQVVSLEGVGSPFGGAGSKVYFHTNKEALKRRLEHAGIINLREGAIVGVSGALLLRMPDSIPASFIFAEANIGLPDSKAAAQVINSLDKYLGLKIDPAPLLKKAQEVESKIKTILQSGKDTMKVKNKKQEISYLG